MKKFDIWLADLNPQFETEPGKIRPVVLVQTDLLNDVHPSTIVLPVTTNVKKNAQILRVHLDMKSDILIDQIRAIDKKRLIKKIGTLTESQKLQVLQNVKIIVME